jgi:hypothetical protein
MGVVVWDTTLDSEIPAGADCGGYEKVDAENIPVPISNQHQRHFYYSGGV